MGVYSDEKADEADKYFFARKTVFPLVRLRSLMPGLFRQRRQHTLAGDAGRGIELLQWRNKATWLSWLTQCQQGFAPLVPRRETGTTGFAVAMHICDCGHDSFFRH